MKTELTPFPDLIYIAGLNTVADHEEQDLTLYPVGSHKTGESAGTVRRLRQYALTADRAAALLAGQQSF